MPLFRVRRRRLQFRLLAIFLLTATVAVPLAVRANREHQYRVRLAAIEVIDAAKFEPVDFDVAAHSSVEVAPRNGDPAERWNVVAVDRTDLKPDDIVVSVYLDHVPISEELLSAIERLPTVKFFTFVSTEISDAQLTAIFNRRSVEDLYFDDVPVSC